VKPVTAERIILGGIVQGVGFRPFVYRLALRLGVMGWVRNDGTGQVEIIARAPADVLAEFRALLLTQAPPAARPALRHVSAAAFTGLSFEIRPSTAKGVAAQGLPADLAPCAACLAELADPTNRRFGYVFTNCTQCGPRYSLIQTLPYDRANTTMRGFALCAACAAEYGAPADRRFHAEPIACPACGPVPRLGSQTGDGALNAALAALRAGQIVAVKGVGGYHLLCDAAHDGAVRALRARKHRPHKPLALLVPEARISDYAETTPAALEVLRAPSRPILLLPKRAGATLSPAIAPHLGEIGVMLPDSPLHHVLAERFGAALVATSANRSGEPMVADDATAEAELTGIADAFLHHNRPIARPVDDSVLRIIDGAPRILRAGRGLCPLEVPLPQRLPYPVLALGGHMKNTIALGFGNLAVISPHLGELDHEPALQAFARMARELPALYGVTPEALIIDAHGGYGSSRWAAQQGLPVRRVWHHHAHAGALAGEYGLEDALIFTWDGVGLGPDGALWGGEILAGRPGAWRVAARFRRFRLQGGDRVAQEPWRAAAALCWSAGLPPPEGLVPDPLVKRAWDMGRNCHETSAVGRLFDGAAALLGLCPTASYDAQAPAELEALANGAGTVIPLPLTQQNGIWEADWAPLLPMLNDQTLPPATRAAMFHESLAALGAALALRLGARDVGLTGGVFQNRRLTHSMLARLRAAGISAHLGRQIPSNDASLSYGQLVEFGASHG
jgi:hydrogenase maturation protein HypF